jgi:DnaK suppressor protein
VPGGLYAAPVVDDPATAPPDEPDPAARLGTIEAALDAVDTALRRLDDDRYGRCDVCGEPQPDHVLAADPLALTCPACAAG